MTDETRAINAALTEIVHSMQVAVITKPKLNIILFYLAVLFII